jgi:hypothetical protein
MCIGDVVPTVTIKTYPNQKLWMDGGIHAKLKARTTTFNHGKRSGNLAEYKQCSYSALRKYSAPLNFATFCHISGFKHKDIKLYFFVKNQQQVGHNHEVERYLLDISMFLTNQKLKNWACKIIQPP